jgi:predicted TPR repeat methyltransferase
MMTDLNTALALTGPDATLALYRDWATTYDGGFATDMQYNLPVHVAAAFLAAQGQGPVLDVGAGTGLLAGSLRQMGFQGQIDALDFSQEMLDVAAEKQLYADLFRADVTQALNLPRRYNGVTSSGTFTAGHVGPVAFGPMLDVALPGALFALSINQRVWTEQGFDTALTDLTARNRISDLQLIDVQIYGNAARALDPTHADDRAYVALFRAA